MGQREIEKLIAEQEADKKSEQAEPTEQPIGSIPYVDLHDGRPGEFRGSPLVERLCRLQALTARYTPSRQLEAKRFPVLSKVETKLLPLEPPGKAERRLAARATAQRLMVAYAALITQCPPETATRMLNKRSVGRPAIGEKAMTATERQRRRREKLLEQATTGATLDQLRIAASGIAHHYDLRRQYLDRAPINAALAMIEAQFAPGRVLN